MEEDSGPALGVMGGDSAGSTGPFSSGHGDGQTLGQVLSEQVWETRHGRDGRTFFQNPATQETTWIDPHQKPWRVAYSRDRRPYYHNLLTREVTWDLDHDKLHLCDDTTPTSWSKPIDRLSNADPVSARQRSHRGSSRVVPDLCASVVRWLQNGTAPGIADNTQCKCNGSPPCSTCVSQLDTARENLPFKTDEELLELLRHHLPSTLDHLLHESNLEGLAPIPDPALVPNVTSGLAILLQTNSASYARSWESYVSELLEFRAAFRHIDVPLGYPGGLGVWVQTQRVRKTLEQEKIRDLRLLGLNVSHLRARHHLEVPQIARLGKRSAEFSVEWSPIQKEIMLSTAKRVGQQRVGSSIHVVDLFDACNLELVHPCACADLQMFASLLVSNSREASPAFSFRSIDNPYMVSLVGGSGRQNQMRSGRVSVQPLTFENETFKSHTSSAASANTEASGHPCGCSFCDFFLTEEELLACSERMEFWRNRIGASENDVLGAQKPGGDVLWPCRLAYAFEVPPIQRRLQSLDVSECCVKFFDEGCDVEFVWVSLSSVFPMSNLPDADVLSTPETKSRFQTAISLAQAWSQAMTDEGNVSDVTFWVAPPEQLQLHLSSVQDFMSCDGSAVSLREIEIVAVRLLRENGKMSRDSLAIECGKSLGLPLTRTLFARLDELSSLPESAVHARSDGSFVAQLGSNGVSILQKRPPAEISSRRPEKRARPESQVVSRSQENQMVSRGQSAPVKRREVRPSPRIAIDPSDCATYGFGGLVGYRVIADVCLRATGNLCLNPAEMVLILATLGLTPAGGYRTPRNSISAAITSWMNKWPENPKFSKRETGYQLSPDVYDEAPELPVSFPAISVLQRRFADIFETSLRDRPCTCAERVVAGSGNIKCVECENFFHAVCVGVGGNEEIDMFLCPMCAFRAVGWAPAPESATPWTDPTIAGQDPSGGQPEPPAAEFPEIQQIICQSCNTADPVTDDLLLLCDRCDAAYHTFCLSPPLDRVPENDWFCPKCTASDSETVATSTAPKSNGGDHTPTSDSSSSSLDAEPDLFKTTGTAVVVEGATILEDSEPQEFDDPGDVESTTILEDSEPQEVEDAGDVESTAVLEDSEPQEFEGDMRNDAGATPLEEESELGGVPDDEMKERSDV